MSQLNVIKNPPPSTTVNYSKCDAHIYPRVQHLSSFTTPPNRRACLVCLYLPTAPHLLQHRGSSRSQSSYFISAHHSNNAQVIFYWRHIVLISFPGDQLVDMERNRRASEHFNCVVSLLSVERQGWAEPTMMSRSNGHSRIVWEEEEQESTRNTYYRLLE